MSYLWLPRIGFISSDATVNVSTANNQNVGDYLDYDNVRIKNPTGMDPAAYRAWLLSIVTSETPAMEGQPEQTRNVLRGYWNYYGNHAVSFGSAKVNSLWLSGDAPITSGQDPLLGARVIINARMIDVDPADTFSSWNISDIFRVVGTDAGGQPVTLIDGKYPTISHTRWLNFNRPWGAGTFQCVIPNQQLTFDESVGSPALEVLRRAAQRGAGLSLRFCMYGFHTDPSITTEYMYEKFHQGDYVINVKYGRILGSIGVWYAQDMKSVPVGRLLHDPLVSPFCTIAVPAAAPAPVSRPRVKTHTDVELLTEARERIRSHAAAAGTSSPRPDRPSLGPAVALTDPQRGVIVLDLLSTFPERGANDPAKIDIGKVSLRLDYTDPRGHPQSAIIGPVPYDQRTYEDQAGVVEIAYAQQPGLDAWVDSGMLSLYWEADPQAKHPTLLQEIIADQVETDDRSFYLQQGQPGTILLEVFVKGQPPHHPVEVRLEQWKDFNVPSVETPGQPYPVVTFPFFCFKRVEPGDPELAIPPSITIPTGGKAQLPIDPKVPGCYKIRFIPPPYTQLRNIAQQGCQDPTPDFTIEFFSNLRVLPQDDYSGYTDEEINNWAFIYKEVFSYYALMYPIMSTIIPWGPDDAPNDSERVREFAALIKQFVDESALESPMYMPITRELSDGKRKLIQRWCDLQLRPGP